MKRYLMFLLFLVLLSSNAFATTRLILIGWDGADRRNIETLLESGELPNLEALIARGSYAEINVTGQTDTKAGWAQILTGYDGDINRVHNNDRYKAIPAGLTVFERLKLSLDDNIYNVFITGKDKHIGSRKIGRHKKLPFYNAEQALDCYALNEKRHNYEVYDLCFACLEEYAKTSPDIPLFAMIHFRSPDRQGHDYREASEQYASALIRLDRFLGKMQEDFEGFGFKPIIIVTSDHGFDRQNATFHFKRSRKNKKRGKTHFMAPYVFMASNLFGLKERGLRLDIAPTIYDAFGVDWTQFEPELQGISLYEIDE